MCRSGRGWGSPSVGRLVAEELVEVTAVGHLAKPGQRPQAHESLTYLAECGVHRVLLGLGPKDLRRDGQRLLVDLYRRLRHGHALCPPRRVWILQISQSYIQDIEGLTEGRRVRARVCYALVTIRAGGYRESSLAS